MNNWNLFLSTVWRNSYVLETPKYNVSEKPITTLEKEDYKNANKDELEKEYRSTIAIRSKCNIVSPILSIAILGFIFFSNNLFLVHPDVIEVKYVGKEINRVENLESVQLKLSSLSRVINAIALHNSFRGDVIAVQNVMIEALDIQEVNLLNTIEEEGVSTVVDTIRTIDLLATQSYHSINEFAAILNETMMDNSIALPNPPNSEVLFFFNVSKFYFPHLPAAVDALNENRTLLIKELSLPKPDSDRAFNFAQFFAGSFMGIYAEFFNSVLNQETKEFIDSLKEATSFISEIDMYQKLTDEKSTEKLTERLESVLPSLTIIKTLENSTQENVFTRHLNIIENLLSKTVKVSDKHALVGFPHSSRDMQLLFRDLDDEWLKNMLNNGNTLSELKRILDPMRIIKTQIVAESIWKKYARNVFSMLIYQSRMKFENIIASKSIYTSNSLANVKDTLRKLRPLANLNSSALNEFSHFLNCSLLFTNFSNELGELGKFINNSTYLVFQINNIVFNGAKDLMTYPEKLVTFLKEKFMNNQYAPSVNLLSTKIRFIEKQRKKIVKLLAQTDNFKNVLTTEHFTKIRQMFPDQFKLDFRAVQNHVHMLSLLSPLTDRERVATEELPDMLSAARNISYVWRELWKDNKTKIEATKSSNSLAYFPFARETSFQLACSQRALDLYRKRDLRQQLQNFVLNGWALAEKIESLPPLEKQLIDSDWRNFLSINKSITTILSGVEKLSIEFTIADHSLKSFGNTLSVLDHINVSTLDFALMIQTLDKLKTMSIGKSKEVSDFEYVLKQMEGLQFAAMRKNGSLTILLAQTDNFFQSFFSKQLKSDWSHLFISVVIFAIALTSILFSIFFCIMTIRTGEPIHQDIANEL